MAAASPARRSAQTALHAILDALVRLYAPVLVHTCEEVWDRLTLDGKEPSVHLARWPTVDESWVNPALAADYARLLEVRTEVTRALELLRQSGAIGRSLDARVRVHAADGGLAMLLAAADLEELFIVSDVTLEPDPDDLPVSGVTGLRVAAEPVPYPRCERCWARRASVGTDPDRPGLCARCIETLRSA